MAVKKIGFQGVEGAFSHQAAKQLFPDATYNPYFSFDDLLKATENQQVDYAVIPIENSTGGRVAEFHYLLRDTKLCIVQEFFMPIQHYLLGNISIGAVTDVLSHPQALAQCSDFLATHQFNLIPHADTAGSAKEIAESHQPHHKGAIASKLAAEIYGLEILAENIQNNADNTTRFLVMAREEEDFVAQKSADTQYITSVIYQLRSVPAALYKTLGGFATANINLVKLESYIAMGKDDDAWFYLEIMAHAQDEAMVEAMRELDLFTQHVRILGVYPASDWRG